MIFQKRRRRRSLCRMTDCEQVIHIEHEYLFATVSNAAKQQTRGVRTAFALPVDVRFLDRNLVAIALRGQRELFVSAQSNHTRQGVGPT